MSACHQYVVLIFRVFWLQFFLEKFQTIFFGRPSRNMDGWLLERKGEKKDLCDDCLSSTPGEIHSLSEFSNKGTLSHNLSPRLTHNRPEVVVFESCCQGWTWSDARHTTAPPASVVKTHTHSFIFTGPTAPLHLKVSGRDLYGELRPPYHCVWVSVCARAYFFYFLATRSLRVYLPAAAPFRPPCTLCVLARAPCLRVCVRSEKTCTRVCEDLPLGC